MHFVQSPYFQAVQWGTLGSRDRLLLTRTRVGTPKSMKTVFGKPKPWLAYGPSSPGEGTQCKGMAFGLPLSCLRGGTSFSLKGGNQPNGPARESIRPGSSVFFPLGRSKWPQGPFSSWEMLFVPEMVPFLIPHWVKCPVGFFSSSNLASFLGAQGDFLKINNENETFSGKLDFSGPKNSWLRNNLGVEAGIFPKCRVFRPMTARNLLSQFP